MPSASKPAQLIEAALVSRFRDDAAALIADDGARIGLAVSGGPDSMAMLKLAAEAFPGRVEAATVDHGLRASAAAEAALVASLCARLGVPHYVAKVSVAPGASVQAAAREARYAALLDWCRDRGLAVLMTAHHADDQAETLLMRLARGAGLAGLAGIRSSREQGGVRIVRPLLGWRKAELSAALDGEAVAQDPSNDDARHDRTHVRRWLAEGDRFDPLRLAATAHYLAEAEAALDWTVDEAIRTRCESTPDGAILADLEGLPRELRRRIVAKLIAVADSAVDGPALERAMDSIEAGRKTSVAALQITPGRRIRLEKAPPRR